MTLPREARTTNPEELVSRLAAGGCALAVVVLFFLALWTLIAYCFIRDFRLALRFGILSTLVVGAWTALSLSARRARG
jgi:hypothetical protein